MKKKIGIVLCLMLSLFLTGAHLSVVKADNENQTPTESEDSVKSGTCGDSTTWKLTSDGTLTISGTGAIADIEYDSRKESQQPWASYSASITKVVVEDGITKIGNYVFTGLENVTSATISNTVESVGEGTFFHCEKLTNVKLSTRLKNIGSWMFAHCESLENVEIPNTVEKLGEESFFGCKKIKKLVLPESITDLGTGTFTDCSNLEDINIPSKVTQITNATFNGCESLKTLIIPRSVTSISTRISIEPIDSTTTLKVYDNSYGLSYAKEKGFNYEIIKEPIEVNVTVNDSNVSKELEETDVMDDTTKTKVLNAKKAGKSITKEITVGKLEEKEIATNVKQEIAKVINTHAVVCQYFDLSVDVKADGTSIGKVTELKNEVEFKVTLSQNLLKEGRIFYVVRVHNGKAERLTTTLKDGTLTFKTNQFSTYAVVYEDKEASQTPIVDPQKEDKGNTGTKEEKGTTTTTKDSKTNTKNVKTGDESNTLFYVELGLMAVVGCAILFLQGKKAQLLNK